MTDVNTKATGPTTVQLKGHAYYQLAAALGYLDGRRHGFERGDIKSVEAFWVSIDDGRATCGFVGGLRDGERFYLESHLDESAPERDTSIKVQRLAREQPYPQLAGTSTPGEWSDDTNSLNQLLAPGRA